jgi:hypothetical protein
VDSNRSTVLNDSLIICGGDIMSNTINWFQSQRLYALLTKASLDKDASDLKAYYEGKLTPKEEAEMIAFLELYQDIMLDTPAGDNA